MKFLLFIGADADATCESGTIFGNGYSATGMRPLHWAAVTGHDIAVDLLLDHGARVNAGSGLDFDTPLSRAAHAGHLSTVELLISRGAKVSIGNQGMCDDAFIKAAREGHIEVVNVLIESGAGNNGCINLAAFDTASFNQPQTLKFLISKGANINFVNKNYSYGFTPLDVALDREDGKELVEILKQAGAKESEPHRYFSNNRGR